MKKFPWFFTLLWLSVFLLMVRLGFWQLDRATEKETLLDQMQQAPSLISSAAALENTHPFQQIKIQGDWLSQLTLKLDNQMNQGVPGYHVYSVMSFFDGQVMALINRGWVAHTQDIKPLKASSMTWTLQQSDWPRPGVQLGEQELSQDDSQIVTYLPEDVTKRWLKERFCGQKSSNDCIILPFIFKLNQQMPDGFVRDWETQIMPPEKHRAYALQWFTMSVVLLGLFFVFLRKDHASQN